jgi:hypothetical protein
MPTVAASPSVPRESKSLRSVFGRIRDADAHEMFPARLWASEFGNMAKPLAELFIQTQPEAVPNSLSVRRERDDSPITAERLESYWTMGCLAPGALDMPRQGFAHGADHRSIQSRHMPPGGRSIQP